MADRYLKLPLSFDTQRLQADLATLKSAHWHSHINRRAHAGGWHALPLRAVDGCSQNITVAEMDPRRYADTRYLKQCTYLPEVLAQLECPLLSARLMSLQAGEKIKRHTDHLLGLDDGYVRLHIPIQTHPDVIFTIDDHPVHFGAGECWYMNANLPHQVSNNSPSDRIHLVVDCQINNRLFSRFNQAGYCSQPIRYKYGDPAINDGNVLSVAAQLEAVGTRAGIEMAATLRTIHQQ